MMFLQNNMDGCVEWVRYVEVSGSDTLSWMVNVCTFFMLFSLLLYKLKFSKIKD